MALVIFLKTKLKKIEKPEIDFINCFKYKNNQFLLNELTNFTNDCTLKKLDY
jgi:hypothetical protein